MEDLNKGEELEKPALHHLISSSTQLAAIGSTLAFGQGNNVVWKGGKGVLSPPDGSTYMSLDVTRDDTLTSGVLTPQGGVTPDGVTSDNEPLIPIDECPENNEDGVTNNGFDESVLAEDGPFSSSDAFPKATNNRKVTFVESATIWDEGTLAPEDGTMVYEDNDGADTKTPLSDGAAVPGDEVLNLQGVTLGASFDGASGGLLATDDMDDDTSSEGENNGSYDIHGDDDDDAPSSEPLSDDEDDVQASDHPDIIPKQDGGLDGGFLDGSASDGGESGISQELEWDDSVNVRGVPESGREDEDVDDRESDMAQGNDEVKPLLDGEPDGAGGGDLISDGAPHGVPDVIPDEGMDLLSGGDPKPEYDPIEEHTVSDGDINSGGDPYSDGGLNSDPGPLLDGDPILDGNPTDRDDLEKVLDAGLHTPADGDLSGIGSSDDDEDQSSDEDQADSVLDVSERMNDQTFDNILDKEFPQQGNPSEGSLNDNVPDEDLVAELSKPDDLGEKSGGESVVDSDVLAPFGLIADAPPSSGLPFELLTEGIRGPHGDAGDAQALDDASLENNNDIINYQDANFPSSYDPFSPDSQEVARDGGSEPTESPEDAALDASASSDPPSPTGGESADYMMPVSSGAVAEKNLLDLVDSSPADFPPPDNTDTLLGGRVSSFDDMQGLDPLLPVGSEGGRLEEPESQSDEGIPDEDIPPPPPDMLRDSPPPDMIRDSPTPDMIRDSPTPDMLRDSPPSNMLGDSPPVDTLIDTSPHGGDSQASDGVIDHPLKFQYPEDYDEDSIFNDRLI